MTGKPEEQPITIQTIIEPFKIKTVEPIRWTTRAEREELLRRARKGGQANCEDPDRRQNTICMCSPTRGRWKNWF